MLKKYPVILIFYFLSPGFLCQMDMGSLVRDKAEKAKEKAQAKAREKAMESFEKSRKDYDESNFNYAICFLDNSGLFEADEKGNAFNSSLLSVSKLAAKEEKSIEDRAYTNLKNGELFMAGNKYALAEQSFKLAKLLYEEDHKQSTTNYAQTLSDLGLLYQSRGRFNKARPFTEDALKLRQNSENKGMLLVSINNSAVLKKETGLYAEAEAGLKKGLDLAKMQNDKLARVLLLNNLAMTYLDMNKLKDAETQMIASITEASALIKENSGNYIKLQINLANIYRFEKKYANAEDLYLLAIKQKEKKLGKHPDLAHLKKGLAQLYMDMGKNGAVEDLLKSAYDIDKRKLGEKNPATVAIQQELANFYKYNQDPLKALDLITKVVEIKKEIYGENHPNYIQALEDMALIQWQNGKIEETKANYYSVIDNTLAYINTFFNSLNDNEKTLYWDKTNNRLQRFYAFASSNSDSGLVRRFYSTVINTKGFLLNNSSKIRNTIFSSNDESLKTAYTQWLETKESLNQAYQLSKEELASEKINIDSLRQRAGELEKELSQKSALFRQSGSEAPLGSSSIQKQLKPGEAAVEIVKLNQYRNGFTDTASYVALLVSAGDIKLVELGDAGAIEAGISDFREKTIHMKPENEAYGITWKVLDEQIKSISRIYLSLDGAYHQLSINALKDASGKYLVDKYHIQFVGNTKDLPKVKLSEATPARPVTAFLIGNPAYGKDGLVPQLPGTEIEVKNITRLLTTHKVKPTALYAANATEAKIKAVRSPSILHIATHGYFLADLSQLETNKVLGVDVSAARENPLLRSGLLLADCENVFAENYRPANSGENGILTAYEAMSLDLDKTDLVVLSACETGLGSVKQGEGVYGLQRAFLIAGAKSIIMSLWSVSDDATMQLMTLFYTNYAKSGNKAQAFSDAIRQLKIKFKQPFYWSAFVMLTK